MEAVSLRCFLLFLPIKGRFQCPSTWVHSVCLKLIHSPAVRLVLSLDTIWLLTLFSELQLDLASSEGMWPPSLAQLLSPVWAWIRSTSSDGQKQIHSFSSFKCILSSRCLLLLLSLSGTHLQSTPHCQAEVPSCFWMMWSFFSIWTLGPQTNICWAYSSGEWLSKILSFHFKVCPNILSRQYVW